ncbi:MAG: hypothetical protein Q8P61_04895 [Candidatus Nanopelagicales bacterium]|nr:hypothetical protein [Candidatus Nanopelagicales bacterium]
MHVDDAQTVVDRLRVLRLLARVQHLSVGTAGVVLPLPDGREVVWDAGDASGLEAQVLRDGVLVGFVPVVPGSVGFSLDQIAERIASEDYERL